MSTGVTTIETVSFCKHCLNLSLRAVIIILSFRPVIITFIFAFIGFFFIEAGVDFENYTQFFDQVRTYDFFDVFFNRVEPLFGILTFLLVQLFTSNFSIYFLFLVLSVSLKAYIISSSRQTGAIFVLFVGFYLFRYFPLYELTQIRVSLAIGLVMMAFQQHGNRFKWILFLLACLTHYSVLVLLPLMFLVDAAQRCSIKYKMHEGLIWLSILAGFMIIGLMFHATLQYITQYFTVLQVYDLKGFGEETVSFFNATILLDIMGIISALAIQRHMSASTRFWIYIQVLGVFSFYSMIEFPIIAFRIRELFCVFWIFYIRDALEYQGIVRSHALLFILGCIIAYFYFYFLGKSAIFTIFL